MLHFFPRYAQDVTDTPFAAELRRLGVPHRFFAEVVSLRYQTVAGLLLRVYPRLTWFAIRSAVRSLVLSQPRPTVAIVGSDIEALVFGLVRAVLRLPTRLVFETLIVTPRASGLKNRVYLRYYGLVLSLVDMAICHSSVEAKQYAALFPRTGCRFVCVPFGTTVTGRERAMAEYAAGPQGGAIVTAGRSGRDYRTLALAVDGLPCELRILCDTAAAVVPLDPSDQVTVVRDCFGQSYIDTLASAQIVVVPLAVDDVSAGQMVLLQAAALGKPIVVTRTATTAEYATDDEDALFVALGDVTQMRDAVRRLLEDPGLRRRLGANAALRFEREHSTEAYVHKLVAAVDVGPAG